MSTLDVPAVNERNSCFTWIENPMSCEHSQYIFSTLRHSFVIQRERENFFSSHFFTWISCGRNALLMIVSVPSAWGVLDARSLFRIGLLCKKSTCTKVLCTLQVNWKRKKGAEKMEKKRMVHIQARLLGAADATALFISLPLSHAFALSLLHMHLVLLLFQSS